MLVRKAEGKVLLERHKHTWKVTIRICFKERGYDCVDWIQIAVDEVQWRAFEKMVQSFRFFISCEFLG